METRSATTSFSEIVLPSVPLKVKIDDLLPDGKLLSADQITQIVHTVSMFVAKATQSKPDRLQRVEDIELQIDKWVHSYR